MNWFYNLSIKSKLILTVVSLLVFALVTFSGFILLIDYENTKDNLIREAKLESKLVSDYAVTPLLFGDKKGAQEVLSKLSTIKNVKAAVIYDNKMQIFTQYLQRGEQRDFDKRITSFSKQAVFTENEIHVREPIRYKDKTHGAIVLFISTEDLSEILIRNGTLLLGLTILLSFLSLIVITRIQNYITYPIINLAKTAQGIALHEDYTLRATKLYDDEVGRLYDDFNTMIDTIEKRGEEREEAETISRTYQVHLERLTNELEERVNDRTVELQDSYSNLQSAQSQLVESEKMSSLGNLVAGVAHEINTPLGISITASSIFKNEIKTLKDLLQENKLSKTNLNHFIETLTEADDILMKNLERAAALVRNFKKISVDQSSEELRDFELNSYLQEVISTFKSEIKHRPIEIIWKLSKEPIDMITYPGAISQIIVNLLQNSLLHAFDATEEGKITIETQFNDNEVKIIYMDDGKGIEESVKDTVFEPFITTKRNQGGTGLGMNITYNLVSQHLRGNIHLDQSYTDGARFIISLPAIIENKEK